MKLLLYLFITLGIYIPSDPFLIPAAGLQPAVRTEQKSEQCITPMEALDKVKEYYAANFDKVYAEAAKDEYYYKSTLAGLSLVYEGEVGTEKNYLIHLYEFVVDEPETGIGHTYTYCWFTVSRITGEITEQTVQ